MKTKAMRDVFRAASVCAVLVAGSCASPAYNLSYAADPRVNHPISVEPDMRTLDVGFYPGAAGLSDNDALRFDRFARDYLESGNGALSVSVPQGVNSSEAIRYFGERLAALGVPRARILVGTRDDIGDGRVQLGFIGYAARTGKCGDWSANAAETYTNAPMPDLGCATQHNLAAMVADPRDLVEPRGLGESDATRRMTVMGKYEKGEITQADKNKVDKTNEQSGSSSLIK